MPDASSEASAESVSCWMMGLIASAPQLLYVSTAESNSSSCQRCIAPEEASHDAFIASATERPSKLGRMRSALGDSCTSSRSTSSRSSTAKPRRVSSSDGDSCFIGGGTVFGGTRIPIRWAASFHMFAALVTPFASSARTSAASSDCCSTLNRIMVLLSCCCPCLSAASSSWLLGAAFSGRTGLMYVLLPRRGGDASESRPRADTRGLAAAPGAPSSASSDEISGGRCFGLGSGE